jgi:hypothetical protein
MLDWLIDFTLITNGTDILFVVLLVFPLSFWLLIGTHRRSKKCKIPDAPRCMAPPNGAHVAHVGEGDLLGAIGHGP